jgi:hypothetical protein
MTLKPLKQLRPLEPLKPLVEPDPRPSTLPAEQSDDPEENAKADHIAMLKDMRRQQQEANDLANSTGYYFCAFFQTEEQCQQFLAAVQVTTGGMYVDGLELAHNLGIALTKRTTKYKTGTLDKRCADMARHPGESLLLKGNPS